MQPREQASRAPGTRCQAHTRAWRDGVLVDQGFEVGRLPDHLVDPAVFLWLDLLAPDEPDMAVLEEGQEVVTAEVAVFLTDLAHGLLDVLVDGYVVLAQELDDRPPVPRAGQPRGDA